MLLLSSSCTYLWCSFLISKSLNEFLLLPVRSPVAHLLQSLIKLWWMVLLPCARMRVLFINNRMMPACEDTVVLLLTLVRRRPSDHRLHQASCLIKAMRRLLVLIIWGSLVKFILDRLIVLNVLPRRGYIVTSVVFQRLLHQRHKSLIKGIDLTLSASDLLCRFHVLLSLLELSRPQRWLELPQWVATVRHLFRPDTCLDPALLQSVDNLLFLIVRVTHPDLYLASPCAHASDVIFLGVQLDNVVLAEQVLFEI